MVFLTMHSGLFIYFLLLFTLTLVFIISVDSVAHGLMSMGIYNSFYNFFRLFLQDGNLKSTSGYCSQCAQINECETPTRRCATGTLNQATVNPGLSVDYFAIPSWIAGLRFSNAFVVNQQQ